MPSLDAPPERHNVYTIPVDRRFADALADGLIAQHHGDREGLARCLIIVPNARAVRAVTDAFVRRAESGLLLPRLIPLGEAGEDGLGAAFDPAGIAAPPPAVAALVRQFALARLIQQARAIQRAPVDASESLRLAIDLARVIDELAGEDVSPSALRALSLGADLQTHWQKSLDLINVIIDQWPDELAAMGRIDLSDRRGRLLAQRTREWSLNPPAQTVVAAGITTAVKPVAALLRCIARSPWGRVVLPGVDCVAPDEEWDAIRSGQLESHPQFQLQLLLDRMGVARSDVRLWRGSDATSRRTNREIAVSNAFAPAQFTEKWQSLKGVALNGVAIAEFATPAAEAQGVAIALREALEIPGQTAALVTPDRDHAARVVAHLRRWGIDANDTAGIPLSKTPPGTLILSLVRMAVERFAPVPLLAVLKHPLVRAGEQRLSWLDGVRALDLKLRGPRPAPGCASLGTLLASAMTAEDAALSLAILSELETQFGLRDGRILCWINALRTAAEALAGDALWQGAAGRALGDFFTALLEAVDFGPQDVRLDAFETLLRLQMDAIAVRPPQGGHPRLFIWGPIESRLQSADVMILSGLNEGVWPGATTSDPWLAPKVRTELGLAGIERRIGIAAHDLSQHLGAHRVLMTRAKRDARSPTVTSRFLHRLDAMSGGVLRDNQLVSLAAQIDTHDGEPMRARRPHPCPPLSARPKKLSVTAVDQLRSDPFAFYASKILRLNALDAVDAEMTAAWRGTMVHAIFQAWLEVDHLHPDALAARINALFADPAMHPRLRALWMPRVQEAMDWIASQIVNDKAKGRLPLFAEVKGQIEMAGITLYGRADRIDRMDGGIAIVDYKTGAPPKPAQVEAGHALQLGLLGLIAERGGFEQGNGNPQDLEYWSLAKKNHSFGQRRQPWAAKSTQLNMDNFVSFAAEHFVKTVERWLIGAAPFTAKLVPEWAPFTDYDQLMRREEWYGRE